MRRAISTKGVFVALLLCLASVSGRATTWVPTEVRDPITGARVKVQEPASSGSYIYHWPGKEDQVFWPYTDAAWLWFNPASGYIAFGGDFTELDASRRAALKDWLQSHYDRHAPPRSRIELLSWAEKVYTVRGMDEDFWRHFFRLMAFETRADAKVSLGYVLKALPLIENRLETALTPNQTLETLYLLSEYNRRLGRDDEAQGYLQQLAAFEVDEKLSGLKQYLLDIAKEQQALSPARPLDADQGMAPGS